MTKYNMMNLYAFNKQIRFFKCFPNVYLPYGIKIFVNLRCPFLVNF
jgi:hypothetical protein